jgi:hypothetical protein
MPGGELRTSAGTNEGEPLIERMAMNDERIAPLERRVMGLKLLLLIGTPPGAGDGSDGARGPVH